MSTLRNWTLGLVALAASMAAHAAAFQNGSFENGNWTASGETQTLAPGSTAVTGWTSYGLEWNGPGNGRTGSVAWLDCPTGCWTDLTPAAGNRFLDLTGYSDWRYGAIYQTFDTVAGQEYLVSFALGFSTANSSAAADPGLFVVAKNGSSIVGDFDPAWQGYTSITPGWSTQTYSFTAGSGTSSLFFAGGYGAGHYVGLDNVTVTAVPEPETYAMMLAGLGALGFMARRRRTQ